MRKNNFIFRLSVLLILPVIFLLSFFFINKNTFQSPVSIAHAQNVCPSPSTAPSVTPTPTPKGILIWSADRKLTWDDFKGSVPSNAPADKAAQSFVGVHSDWKTTFTCVDAGGGLRKCTVTITEVKATAQFDQNQSWVRPDSKTDSLLKHEQGHFDISEIFAKKKQKEMEKLIGTSESATACNDDEALKEANKKIEDKIMKICDQINKEEDDMQNKYDNQTKNGTDPKEQEKWNDKIAKMLEKK